MSAINEEILLKHSVIKKDILEAIKSGSSNEINIDNSLYICDADGGIRFQIQGHNVCIMGPLIRNYYWIPLDNIKSFTYTDSIKYINFDLEFNDNEKIAIRFYRDAKFIIHNEGFSTYFLKNNMSNKIINIEELLRLDHVEKYRLEREQLELKIKQSENKIANYRRNANALQNLPKIIILIIVIFIVFAFLFALLSPHSSNNGQEGTKCYNCDGTGEVREWANDGTDHHKYVECPVCHGKGYIR